MALCSIYPAETHTDCTMPASFDTALQKTNVVDGTDANGCTTGGILKYGETCTVSCKTGFAPSADSTLAYTCNAAKGGDVDFDAKPNITCVPGIAGPF